MVGIHGRRRAIGLTMPNHWSQMTWSPLAYARSPTMACSAGSNRCASSVFAFASLRLGVPAL